MELLLAPAFAEEALASLGKHAVIPMPIVMLIRRTTHGTAAPAAVLSSLSFLVGWNKLSRQEASKTSQRSRRKSSEAIVVCYSVEEWN